MQAHLQAAASRFEAESVAKLGNRNRYDRALNEFDGYLFATGLFAWSITKKSIGTFVDSTRVTSFPFNPFLQRRAQTQERPSQKGDVKKPLHMIWCYS